jgi:hypothetical protein
MVDDSKYRQFIDYIQNLDCDIDSLSKGRVGKVLPEKLLKNICGGKTGFSKVKEKPEFSR